MDFTVKQTNNSTPELTKTIGNTLLNMIVQYGNSDLAFKNQPNSEYEPEHFKIIDKEIERLFKEINKLCSGTYLITPRQVHIDEETGETVVDQEAVYYTPSTKTDLKTMFESDYLDDTLVLRTFVEWKGFNYDTEFDQFLTSYNE